MHETCFTYIFRWNSINQGIINIQNVLSAIDIRPYMCYNLGMYKEAHIWEFILYQNPFVSSSRKEPWLKIFQVIIMCVPIWRFLALKKNNEEGNQAWTIHFILETFK